MRSVNRVLPLLSSLVLAACASDLPTTPKSTESARLARASASAQGDVRHSMSEKYRELGARPARGRSGSATLEVRALMGRDGVTALEATTGSLEDGSRPGQISKVQVKLSSANGLERTWNDNTARPTGYWSQALTGAEPTQSVQVQANIRGIDPQRTDVVTVSTPIYRRPDLAVGQLTVPTKVQPGMPTPIMAVVTELNGDVGARGDCVLLVDGAEVQRLAGIWVDAGDAVTCSFSHAFVATGSHTVSVLVSGVNPGDWRDDNNRTETTVSVTAPHTLVERGVIAVSESDRTDEWWGNWVEMWTGRIYRDHRFTHTRNFVAVAFGVVDEPMSGIQRMENSLSVNGVTFGSVATTQPTRYEKNESGWCWEDSKGGIQLVACSWGSETAFSMYRAAGSVTYRAYGEEMDQWGVFQLAWVWNYDTPAAFDWPPLPDGATFRILLDVVGTDGKTYRIDQSVALQVSEYQGGVDPYQWTGNSAGILERVKTSFHERRTAGELYWGW